MGDEAVKLRPVTTPHGDVLVSGAVAALNWISSAVDYGDEGAADRDSTLVNGEEEPRRALGRLRIASDSGPVAVFAVAPGGGVAAEVDGRPFVFMFELDEPEPTPGGVEEEIQAEIEEAAKQEGARVWVEAGVPEVAEEILRPDSTPEWIASEREHPAGPAFDPRAAAEPCSHPGCRRRAFAVLRNDDQETWLVCAEHYEQGLAAQARAGGHEPAWRVPIGPGVTLERRYGGPIGVVVDGHLRNYVTAGELAKVFEGPVE